VSRHEDQIWEERVYAGGALLVRGPAVTRWTTKAYFMRRFLDLRPTDRVLDVGCGVGEFTLLAARSAHLAVGLDAAPTAIAAAREAAERLGVANVEWIEGSAYELAERVAARAPFDKIICFDLLEHLSDPALALRQMRAVLRPGGRALLYTNCFGRWSTAYLREWRRTGGRVGELWEPDQRDHHLARFTPDALRALTADWRARLIYKNHFLVPLSSWLVRRLDRLRASTSNTKTKTGDATPAVSVQPALRAARLIVQALKLAISVAEMETLGRLVPGAGVYLLLERPA